jgi:hypothetical protein
MSKHEENRLKKIGHLKSKEIFLREFNEHKEEYAKDSELLEALSAQGKWAKYSGNNLIDMSLNSYKDLAERSLYDGFKGIDDLRNTAFVSINNYLRSGDVVPRGVRSDTRQGMKTTINSQKKQLSIVREANIVLSKAIEATIDGLDRLANETLDSNIKDMIEDEMSKIKALLRRSFMLNDLDLQKRGSVKGDKE